MVLPRQNILSLGSAVTVATTCAFRFSSFAACIKTSVRHLLDQVRLPYVPVISEIASSVPSKPSYFFGTLSKLMRKPSANSPIATQTPPAPKSLQRLIRRETSGFRNSRWIFRSVGGFPFCTSAPQTSTESFRMRLARNRWLLHMPSRPVAAAQQNNHISGLRELPGSHWLWEKRRLPRRSPCAWPHSR